MSINRYLKRMDASMGDKMRVLSVIPEDAELVLDVGCASGHITGNMASRRPETHFHGIDVSLPLVGMAQQQVREPKNVSFSHNWLSDLHNYDTKYDAITFMSVLHEFYSYGKGLTSVIKAICDAYELLNYGGVLVIRDMIRGTQIDPTITLTIGEKLRSIPGINEYVKEYEDIRGGLEANAHRVNDLLLHLLYRDNWQKELKETYVYWNVKQFIQAGITLNMQVEAAHCYLLDYVKERWRKELWLNEMEMSTMYSTGIVALRK